MTPHLDPIDAMLSSPAARVFIAKRTTQAAAHEAHRTERRPCPRRPNRKKVVDYLSAQAFAAGAASISDYVVQRLEAGATQRGLGNECRAALAGSVPEGYPGSWWFDRFAFREIHGPVGTPTRDAVDRAMRARGARYFKNGKSHASTHSRVDAFN